MKMSVSHCKIIVSFILCLVNRSSVIVLLYEYKDFNKLEDTLENGLVFSSA